MSDLLSLAKQLRSLSDADLAKLIRRRQIANRPKDFLDLAQQLMLQKSIETCVNSMTLGELRQLRAIANRDSLEADLVIETGLVYQADHGFKLVEAARDMLPKAELQSATSHSSEVALHEDSALAAISVFETQQAITELLLDAEQRVLRVVNRGSFGLPDVKKLATQMHKSLEFSKNCYLIAQRIGLLRANDSRWWLTATAQQWLELNPVERWQLMASDWLSSFSASALTELKTLITSDHDMRNILARVFPLADRNLKDRLTELSNQAEWLGLAVARKPNRILACLLSGATDEAVSLLTHHLPKPQRKLLAQGDQTLVALGPLPTELEILVRTFSELEQVSLACTYRITEQSISYALECGMTETQIRATLTELTGTALPQPIDYVINQAALRFARIKIAAGEGLERSQVSAQDAILLSELLNDLRLRPFALHPISARTLASRFEPTVLYYGLRESGYLAVLVDSSGKVISPKQSISWHRELGEAALDAAEELVAELRRTDARVGESPSDDDLLRQLQLAIKNRATVKVHLKLRDNSETVFELKVASLANGRLRGLDSRADAERVLPLSQITRIEF